MITADNVVLLARSVEAYRWSIDRIHELDPAGEVDDAVVEAWAAIQWAIHIRRATRVLISVDRLERVLDHIDELWHATPQQERPTVACPGYDPDDDLSWLPCPPVEAWATTDREIASYVLKRVMRPCPPEELDAG